MTSQSRRQLVWFVIIVVFVFLPNNLFAQEETETPDAPTITATLASTELPTSTAVPTSTNTATLVPATTIAPSPTETAIVPEITEVVASDTPAAEVTDEVIEPTLAVTNSVQAVQTETALPTTQAEVTEGVESEQTEVVLQPESEPDLTAIVSEPFLAETNVDWSFGAGWQLVPLDGNYALQANGVTQRATYIQSAFADVAVEALVQSQDMMIELYLRQSEFGSYHLSMSPDGTVAIHKDNAILASTTVVNNVPNQWRHIRLSAIGHTLRASIDNVEILMTADTQPLSVGTVSFIATTTSPAANQTLLIDNVRIWVPLQELDVVTPTPESTEVLTSNPESTEVINGTSILSNQTVNWDLLIASDFNNIESDYLDGWEVTNSTSIIPFQNGGALQVSGGGSPMKFILESIDNVAIESDVYVQEDNPIQISVREGIQGGTRLIYTLMEQ